MAALVPVCIGERVDTPPEKWHWTKDAVFYAGNTEKTAYRIQPGSWHGRFLDGPQLLLVSWMSPKDLQVSSDLETTMRQDTPKELPADPAPTNSREMLEKADAHNEEPTASTTSSLHITP
ncbi:hypothetical protein CFIMG_005416RA [Ceratocystis fimbriata CBS 114723]|uniref:Uncharacterized protein n=1 Tax=Ceratocystis fimbriata CBS 114723 TaxID=1035309 RepID=A0A2C5WUR0_9PEZI|nr:hypothetical protein CFIMG_005416RA [Ceratocystis fimbriata CBS 114723]